MAAITVAKRSTPMPGGRTLVQFYGTGASNQADTLTITAAAAGGDFQLATVEIAYSGAATYTGTALTITKDSGLGSGYDTLLDSGTDNGRYKVYSPTGLIYFSGAGATPDALVVAVPAGGAVTAAVTVTLIQE
jgi:hypothetical protein